MLRRASYFQLSSLGVSSGDETLRLMLDMLLENTLEPFLNSIISSIMKLYIIYMEEGMKFKY